MADLTITATSVVAGSNARINRQYDAGATITAGKVVYRDTADDKWKLADNNSATAAVRGSDVDVGIALNGASDGQPLAVQTAGDITIGASLTAGAEYLLSDTPGGIGPRADLATGEYVVSLGLAKSTTVLALDINYIGVATP